MKSQHSDWLDFCSEYKYKIHCDLVIGNILHNLQILCYPWLWKTGIVIRKTYGIMGLHQGGNMEYCAVTERNMGQKLGQYNYTCYTISYIYAFI